MPNTSAVLLEEVRRARENWNEATAALTAAYECLFPVGSVIAYEHGDHVIRVEVLESGDRLYVRGVTGAKYCIDAFRPYYYLAKRRVGDA